MLSLFIDHRSGNFPIMYFFQGLQHMLNKIGNGYSLATNV